MLLVIFKGKTKVLLGQNPPDSKPLLGTSIIKIELELLPGVHLQKGWKQCSSLCSFLLCTTMFLPYILIHCSCPWPEMGHLVTQSCCSLPGFSISFISYATGFPHSQVSGLSCHPSEHTTDWTPFNISCIQALCCPLRMFGTDTPSHEHPKSAFVAPLSLLSLECS